MVARKGQVLISWVDPEDRDAFKNLCATEEQVSRKCYGDSCTDAFRTSPWGCDRDQVVELANPHRPQESEWVRSSRSLPDLRLREWDSHRSSNLRTWNEWRTRSSMGMLIRWNTDSGTGGSREDGPVLSERENQRSVDFQELKIRYTEFFAIDLNDVLFQVLDLNVLVNFSMVLMECPTRSPTTAGGTPCSSSWLIWNARQE